MKQNKIVSYKKVNEWCYAKKEKDFSGSIEHAKQIKELKNWRFK